MNLPVHIRRRQGAYDLATFLREACRQPCPVLFGGIYLWVLSYGGRWDAERHWNEPVIIYA